MTIKSELPTIAILADMPLGRLMPEQFGAQDKTLTPWLYSLFLDFAHQDQFNIHWITLKRFIKKEQRHEIGRQTVHVLPAPSLAIGLFTGHYIASRSIQNKLKEIAPDLVHIWGIESPYAKACSTFNTRKLLTYQGALIAYCQRGPMKLLPRLQAFWEKRTTPLYGHITGESPWSTDRIKEVNPKANLYVVEYGVEDSFFKVRRTPTETPECLYVGTLYELKGIRYLIEAFKHPSMQHIQLYLAGSGDLQAELEPISTPNIHWEGQLSRPELQKRMESAWCLVHPTLADTGPTIVKEARVVGLPVITTTEAGSKQHIVDGKSGYIIPPRDSEAIRETVLKLTESIDKCLEMGNYQLDRIRETLNVHRTSEQFASIYRKILEENP